MTNVITKIKNLNGQLKESGIFEEGTGDLKDISQEISQNAT